MRMKGTEVEGVKPEENHSVGDGGNGGNRKCEKVTAGNRRCIEENPGWQKNMKDGEREENAGKVQEVYSEMEAKRGEG